MTSSLFGDCSCAFQFHREHPDKNMNIILLDKEEFGHERITDKY